MSRRLSLRLREAILRRDGYRCQACGASNVDTLEIDHKYPVALGGSNRPINLQVVPALQSEETGLMERTTILHLMSKGKPKEKKATTCMVCGAPYTQHTPQELADGCHRDKTRK